jgi:DNA polymerase III sliding clamp (beta) subunit (PCNA family)
MKFIVNSTALLRELQKLNGVISSNNTLPILDNFLFNINNNKMSIVASDLETTMMSSISVEADEDGKITIPARILNDTLKTFSNQPLTFVVDSITFGIEMSSELGNYKLAGQNADEFPKMPTLQASSSTTIKGDVLANAINKTLFASGNDELRPVMSGVFCELSSEQTTFVATDAHKLVRHTRFKVAGSELQITSEDLDFANKAEERLSCQYEGEDMEIGFNSKFVIDMLNNIGAEQISIEMSAPNRAGIILPLDGLDEGENTLMLVMPVMLNS